LLYFEDDLTVVGQAANGYQGIEMAKAKQPHIVLMDINMPDMDGITATSLLTDQVPFSQVIMISVQSDPVYMKQAMVAGARDFQPKPFTADDLINCIRRVYKIGQPVFEQYESNVSQKPKQGAQKGQQRLASTPKNGKIVALFSPKGGVGTSTIASNLAVALQKKACQTVVVDADLQFGDILVHFNIRDTRNMINLVQGGELALDLIPEILVPHSSGVHLLLGPQKPVMAEMVTSAILGSIIMDLKTRFDMVIVDLSHLLTDHILAVLERADHVLIATAPELSSVKSTRQFLELCHQLDLSLKKMSLVINFADRPGSIPPQQIEKALKLAQIYQIPFDGDVQAAINEGIVLTERSAKKEISQAIVKLAEQLHQKLSEANEEELEAQVA
jgi:pilus assembly protein CpaE